MNAPNELTGLSQLVARARLREEGYNELPVSKPRNLSAIAVEVVQEPMFLLLIVAGGIYLVLGDVHEALVLLLSVFVILAITIYQERKTERALEALRDMASPRALVIRDGRRLRIPGREVARGDLLVLQEGDRVPADAVLWSANDLRVDESLLTGESVPVRKLAWDGVRQTVPPGGDDLPFVYSGTLLVQGQGIGEVLATGARSEMGKIGKSLATLSAESTPLQRETRRVVRDFAAIGLSLCVLVVLLYGFNRGSWLDGVLAGITLAMATLPEEFPVVLTVFLALGAWRISKQRVLTRRVPAIETLGSATVLCVDKTGTLTMNRMRLRQLHNGVRAHALGEEAALPLDFHELLLTAILASESTPHDPMERAFHEAGQKAELAHAAVELVREYPISTQLLVHAHGWRLAGGAYLVAAKGAPEAIAEVCRLSAEQRGALQAQVNAMAADGLRVLGVACAPHASAQWPEDQREFQYRYLGLVALSDPVRPTVARAVEDCYGAGIRVVMITGDYPVTAQAVAREIGLRAPQRCLTGEELARMSEEQLRAAAAVTNIFARVLPEQKLKLVTALKASGEVVGMTGDGVNDAPALKAAHIGIAMGERGTDVAREAAALVLLDDDFDSIVATVRLGRRIYDNIRNAMSYLVAVHIPTAGMALLPLLFGWPLVIFPVHVVFLEFVIDPACSVAFEAEPVAKDAMRRPPRPPNARLFSFATLTVAILQGVSVLAAVVLLYAWSLTGGLTEREARAMAFAAIVFGNIVLIVVNRSHTQTTWAALRAPNPASWWVVGATLLGLLAVLYLPSMANLFRLAPLSPSLLGVCLLAVVVAASWVEGYKYYLRHASGS